MARYIDADELTNEINNEFKGYMLDEQFSPMSFEMMVDEAPTVDVVGCSEYEKLCLVNLDLAETNKGLLVEHKELIELRSKIDKAIEEIKELIKGAKLPTVNIYNKYSEGLQDCLEIFERNIGE